MIMRWDALLVREVARELDASLKGARARAVLLDRAGSAVALFLRNSTKVMALAPGGATWADRPAQEPPPGALPLPAKIIHVDGVEDERILRIHFRRVRGKTEDPILIFELGPVRPNAVLVGRSTGRIQAVLHSSSKARSLGTGLLYPPMDDNRRRGADGALSEAEWDELLGALGPGEARRGLLSQVAWSSALNAPLLLNPLEGYPTWKALVERRTLAPGWLEADGKGQPYPVPLPGTGRWHSTSTLLEAISAAKLAAPESEIPPDSEPKDLEAPAGAYVPGEAIQSLETSLQQAERVLSRLRQELKSSPVPADLRAIGDLVLARLGEIPRGREEVTLVDFEGAPVTVRLNPALEPAENARLIYDRAAKAERVRARLPERIEKAEDRVASAREALDSALSGTLDPTILAGLVGSGGAGSGQQRIGSQPIPGLPGLPYRTYRSSGGLEIRVGRGAKHNDALTFRHARPMDVWLHARSVGGAHVVLRWNAEERPPKRDLEEAAALAALHSKARTSSTVPVDWTRRKWVRKPRKAKPGTVTMNRAETVFVEPDPSLLDRLKDDS